MVGLGYVSEALIPVSGFPLLGACLASVSTGLAFQLGERPADEFGDGMIF